MTLAARGPWEEVTSPVRGVAGGAGLCGKPIPFRGTTLWKDGEDLRGCQNSELLLCFFRGALLEPRGQSSARKVR